MSRTQRGVSASTFLLVLILLAAAILWSRAVTGLANSGASVGQSDHPILTHPEVYQGRPQQDLVDDIPKDWSSRPTNTNGGTIYKPNDGIVENQIRVMPGDPKSRHGADHQGPYSIISRRGDGKPVRVLHKGNPGLPPEPADEPAKENTDEPEQP